MTHSPSVLSITKGPRSSNFELLRIIAMFMVMILHADFIVLGVPTKDSIELRPCYEIVRIVFEAISVCGVNIFILISGWFGIKATVRGFLNFWFQVVFFYALSFICMVGLGMVQFSIGNLMAIVCLKSNGWFVVSYSILYILSPVLNEFRNSADMKKYIWILISFFAFEAVYSVIADVTDFSHGYSTVSFVGLYLLSGLLRRLNLGLSAKHCGLIFLAVILLNSTLILLSKLFSVPLAGIGMYYSSPLVILACASLVLFISKCDIKPNRLINWVAASSFAVYLLHDNVFTAKTCYMPMIQGADAYGGLPAVFIAMVCVYIISLSIDQIRKFIWSKLN